jgi:hypothetical protein
MLNSDAFVISQEKCVVASFTSRGESINSLRINLSICEGAKIDLEQTINVDYETLHQLYYDIQNGNPNPRIVDLNLHDGVKISHTPKGRNFIQITPRRLYDVLILARRYFMNKERTVNDKFK